MSKTYSAGIVTAYGAAKRAGYQGTYEDFCRQQAGYAESAATVEQAKNTAVSAANTATTKAGEAATAATAAQTAKTQTQAAATQALTDIGTARSGAISAVQTEGATQTANARAQAQAAATSATTASTKASEASASATTATTKATEAAASATSAANSASAAQGVKDSIPQDYSDLSAEVSALNESLDDVKADLSVSSDFYGSLLYCDFASYNTISGSPHSSTEMIISINVPSGTPIYVNIGFDKNNTAQIAPTFYYSDGTSMSKASVTVNGTYTYKESKDVIGIGFYNGATLPNGKMSIGVWSAKSPTEILKSINTGNGVLAIFPKSGTDANTLDKNMTLYSFGTSNIPANLPTGVQVGNLINLRGDSTTQRSAQILIDSQTNQMYFRAKTDGSWSSWSGTISNQITLKKTASNTFSIYVPNENGHVVRYDYIHRTKTWGSLTYTDGNGQAQTASNVKSCDIWNNYYIYNNDNNTYIAQGHSNFIVNINDDVDKYCGDGHGNEVIISYDVIADGAEIDISNMAVNASVKCSSLRLITRSNIYKVGGADSNNNYDDSYPLLDTNGNPIVALFHYMEMLYEIGNKVTINNKIVIKQNNMVFNECHGAMLECQFTDFGTVICNNEENTQNDVSDSGTFAVATGSTKSLANTAQRCNIVEMFGKDFYIRQSMTNDPLSDGTTNVVYFNKYPNRLKCYFQPVKTVNRSISDVTPDTFNVGDVIVVTDVREINI